MDFSPLSLSLFLIFWGRFSRGSFRPESFRLVLWVGRFAHIRRVVSPVGCFARELFRRLLLFIIIIIIIIIFIRSPEPKAQKVSL